MSPKTFKNKKESNDSKRPDSKFEFGSAPFSKFNDDAPILGSPSNDVNLKKDPDLGLDEKCGIPIPVPPLRQDSDDEGWNNDENGNKCKATEYFDRFAKAVVKVFSDGKQVMVFPMFVKNFIDKKGYFESIGAISNSVCEMVDSELERNGYYPFFIGSVKYEHGYACDLRMESSDDRFDTEVKLHEKNYEDMFFSTYLDMNIINLHIHIKENIMCHREGIFDADDAYKSTSYANSSSMEDKNLKVEDRKDPGSHAPMFRGHPIDMSTNPRVDTKYEDVPINSMMNQAPTITPHHFKERNVTPQKSTSPVSVYDEDD
mmetsp:Transcript_3560/g.6722  ORF Transcript_3560/g.6722 Transcript_3560/m.6722 type:complete len:316 (-) Transcript_3560:3789-4736(-)